MKRKSCGAGALAWRPCPRPVSLAGLLGGRTSASAAVQGDRPTTAPNKSWLSQMDTQFLRFPVAQTRDNRGDQHAKDRAGQRRRHIVLRIPDVALRSQPGIAKSGA